VRSRLGWEEAFVVLSLRSWEPVYGIDVLLRGFALAAEQSPRLRLMMMGGGSLAPMVHQMIRQHDMADRVTLGGQVSQENLPQVYHSADLYVSASHSDGSSVSLMEALGCGLPVLVSDIPSNREWVTGGEQGWLFPDGDARALCQGILRVLDLPGGLTKIGEAARARAELRADWQINFKVLERAYEKAVQAARK
jgi:glycosyltransferase involved in cell wall biosynthesis